MKFTLAASTLALLASPVTGLLREGNQVQNVLDDMPYNLKNVGGSVTHFYDDAIVDHFTHSVTQKQENWSQRYYSDDQFWCGEGCPIFLYIGGEGAQGPVTDKLFMYTLAEEQGAMMIAVEHRFYGESYPTKDMSNENLVYLTSDQALADLARFIEYLTSMDENTVDKSSSPPLKVKASTADSKIVAFGGSYPGNLATWLKLKYPASVAGSIGSSAPVKADYNYYKYAQVVGSALAYPLIGGSQECYDIVEKAMGEIHDSVSNLADSKKECGDCGVPAALSPCTPIENDLDMYAYESNIFGNFQGVVQYNLQSFGGTTVADVCNEMTNPAHNTALEALNSMVSMYFPTPTDQTDPNTTCIASNWKAMLADLTNVKFDGSSAMRQWIYQSCNEFGYFQTTEGDDHPFTSLTSCSLEIAGKEMCEQAYDIKNYNGPQKSGASGESYASDETYGARSVQGANITMPNGNMDPWHSLGVINATARFFDESQELTKSETVVFIDGTAHCRDMYAPNAFAPAVNDTGAVVWAHSVIKENVLKYIKK